MSEIYEGYLHFAGTEIANAARTQAYLENIIPRFGFDSCWDAEDLPCVLGDAPYRTPVLDPAPWFSAARPASAKFLGFYPLSIVGIEDSSREVNVTQLVQDGAVFSRPRKASKEFRISGILAAEDGEGMDVGMSWLRGALEGAECLDGDCAGDTFCYLAYLPPCCDYNNAEAFPPVPVDWSWVAGSNGPWAPYSGGTIISNNDGVRVGMPCPGDGVQLHIEGLIPGATYRAIVEVASADRLHLGIGGSPGITAKRTNEHFPDSRNPWVGDFVANGEVQTLRVLSGAEVCDDTEARIYSVRVERTAEKLAKFLPRFTNESFTEPASWAAVETTAIDRSVAVAGPDSVEMLSLIWTNTTGSTVTIEEGTGGRRLVRGLAAGQEYILYIKALATTGVALNFTIQGADGVTTALGNSWFAVAFTASTPQHYLDVLTSADAPLVGNSSESIDIEYIRVDANPQTLYIAPIDQSEKALRTLHNVTLLDGPNVIEEFHKEHGTMRSVEFTMAVGEPAIYGQSVDIQPTIEATTFLIGDTQCQEGFPIRFNSFSNPRLAGETPGDAPVIGVGQHGAIVANDSTVVVVAAGGTVPEQSIGVTPTDADSYFDVEVDEADLMVGHTYTVSATLSMTDAQTGVLGDYARSIAVPTGGGTIYSEQGVNAAGAQRISVTFTYLGGTPAIRFYNGADTGGGVVYWSYFLFEESGFAGSPFDGDGPTAGDDAEYTWLGTAHASTSRFAEDAPLVIADPDCPPVPVAPQPPGITPDCPRNVDEWRRYWTEVPPELAGGWREAVPVIKLSTGENVVRDVRVRFFANPQGAPLGEVDECGACGEFYISYIPAATVMTIDGIRRRVTANVAGTGEANAMHLASDADYGPVRWPTMTCDIGYYMTVDITPDEVLDLDVRLAVAQRE